MSLIFIAISYLLNISLAFRTEMMQIRILKKLIF